MKEAKLMAGEVLERWPEPTSLHALVERLFVELFRYGSLSAIAFHFDFSLGVLELHWRTIPDTNAAPSLDVKDWLTNCCTRTVLAASSLRIEGVFAHRPIIRRQLEAQAGRLASELLSTVLRPWAALYVNVSWEVALMGSGTLAFARHFRWDNPNDKAASEQPWLHRMRQLLNETAAVVRFSTHVIAGNLPASPMPSRSASGEWHLALVHGFRQCCWIFGWNGRPLKIDIECLQRTLGVPHREQLACGIAQWRDGNATWGAFQADGFDHARTADCWLCSGPAESCEVFQALQLKLRELLGVSTSTLQTDSVWGSVREQALASITASRRSCQRHDVVPSTASLRDPVLADGITSTTRALAFSETLGRPRTPPSRCRTRPCTRDTSNFPPSLSVFTTRALERLQPGWESDLYGAQGHCPVPILPDLDNARVEPTAARTAVQLYARELEDAVVVGQFDAKFIVFRVRSDIFLLDQHAADERARFEQLTQMYQESLDPRKYPTALNRSVSLRVPLLVDLGSRCLSATTCAFLRHFGWSWDEASSEKPIDTHIASTAIAGTEHRSTLRVRSVPSVLGQQPLLQASDLLECIDLMLETDHAVSMVPAAQRVLETLACRHAIMFGDRLDLAACQQLLKRLSKCRLPFQCAHGRPSVAALSCPRRPR